MLPANEPSQKNSNNWPSRSLGNESGANGPTVNRKSYEKVGNDAGNIMKFYAGLLVSTLGLSVSVARAEEAGFYVAASFGQGEQSIDSGRGILVSTPDLSGGGNLAQIVQPDSRDVDGKDFAIGATLGYRVNKYFAGELGYIDLGKAEVEERFSILVIQGVPPTTFERKLTSRVSGPTVSVLGSYPLTESLSVSLRAGILFADQEFAEFGPELTFGDEVWLAGVGASYSFAARWTARVEYQRSDDLDATIVAGETKLEQWLLSVLYRL